MQANREELVERVARDLRECVKRIDYGGIHVAHDRDILRRHFVEAAELLEGLATPPRSDSGEAERLREALEPFAAVAAKLNPDLPDDTPITLALGTSPIYFYALERFRKARAALASGDMKGCSLGSEG